MRMKDDDWAAVLDANLSGGFVCAAPRMRPMMKKRWGRIVNISAVVGRDGNEGQSNYVATKAGLMGFQNPWRRNWPRAT